MARIPTYKDYSSNEDMYDDQWEDDASDAGDYNKVTRFGIDDPLAMRDVDLSTRLDLLHVMMLAYDVAPSDLIAFINLLYPKSKEGHGEEKLKAIRTSTAASNKLCAD